MKLAVVTVLAALAATPALAQSHPCAGEAHARAEQLLRFHFDEPDAEVYVDEAVTELAPVHALQGRGSFDVLELQGYIYRAEYRMRLIYAQIPGSCVLMGEEILEASDPY